MKSVFKALTSLAVVASLMAGCAVYEPPYAYDQYPYYRPMPDYGGAGYYALPAPVYGPPSPAYVKPPVSLHFHFRYEIGHAHHHAHSYHSGRWHGLGHSHGGWKR